MSKNISIPIATTLTLCEQFQITLSSPSADPAVTESSAAKDALPLLTASSTALKSQVTKLSLLAITTPFTHSAICTVLSALNESVLPSLVTAALLVTPNAYTKAFHTEIRILSKTTLKELFTLVQKVKTIAEKKDKAKKEGGQKNKEEELSQPEKDAVTVATGRVWDACDTLIDVAGKGVVGFVVRRVEEWRDLVRDAVEEIEEWDPEEEADDFFDDLLGDNGNDKDDDDDEKGTTSDDEDQDEKQKENIATLQAQKKTTIRFLKPIAQIFPAILANRLKNAGNLPESSPSGIPKLESLTVNLQRIPEYIDEAAGALYEANMENSVRYLGKARSCASNAIELVTLPWNAEGVDGQQSSGDKFTIWSKTWLKVMDEVGRSIDDAKKGSSSQ